LKKEFLLGKEKCGYILWQHAALFGRLQTLQILWNLAKEVELNLDELMLAKTWEGFTAFELVTERNPVETL